MLGGVHTERKGQVLKLLGQIELESLAGWGWDAQWQDAWEKEPREGEPARVIEEQRGLYRLATASGSCEAELAGRFRHRVVGAEDLPGVGDFVDAAPASRHRIHAVLPRRSQFVRRAAGGAGAPQVAAANVDYTFIVQALGHDFSPRRLERYLALAWEGGSSPVVVLNKVDQVPDAAVQRDAAASAAPGVPVHAVSAATGSGLEHLAQWLAPGRTVVLLGSSGVGKSTLANALLSQGGDGQRGWQAVGAIREQDGRGRHTTTARHLLRLSGGALLIDSPGMREVGLIGLDEGLSSAFTDVEKLAAACRFADCKHQGEPGCAMDAALAEGQLDPDRLAAYRKLEREQAFQARKENRALAHAARREWARRARAGRQARRDQSRGGGLT